MNINSTIPQASTDKPLKVSSSSLHIIDLMAEVRAGFPSPAEYLGAKRIDLTQRLIKHPQATFLLRARGDSMKGAGIFDGDVLVVDRSIAPRSGHVVVAVVDGEFVCKTLWLNAGCMRLKAASSRYPDIIPHDGQTVEVWGVVLHAIKSMPA